MHILPFVADRQLSASGVSHAATVVGPFSRWYQQMARNAQKAEAESADRTSFGGSSAGSAASTPLMHMHTRPSYPASVQSAALFQPASPHPQAAQPHPAQFAAGPGASASPVRGVSATPPSAASGPQPLLPRSPAPGSAGPPSQLTARRDAQLNACSGGGVF